MKSARPPAEAAIVVDQLVKTYAGRRAVAGLSFSVQPGELLALLGPNGAGKTTTVEILEGYRRPDGGSVRVLGLDPIRDGSRLKPRVGLMLQQSGVYPAATPLDMLNLFAHFYANPLAPGDLLRQVGLESAARTRFRRLSGGQQQRLSLALALIGRPELLFLDEPTAAMDPQARHATWDLIRAQRRAGVTILLTTHFMDEAERLADRVAIIDQGRLVALESPAELVGGRADGEAGGGPEGDTPRSGTERLHFSTTPGLDLGQLSARLGGTDVREEASGQYVAQLAPSPAQLADLTAWLRDQGALLSELRIGHRTLEDVFLSLTGREFRD